MRGIFAFLPPLPSTTTVPLIPFCSLYFGSLQHCWALEFSLVSECSPTITISHKQWGLLIGGLRGRVAVVGQCSWVLLAASLANAPKSPKVEARSGAAKDLKAALKNAPSLKDHKHMLQLFLHLSSLQTDSDGPNSGRGMLVNVRKPQKYRGEIVLLEFPAFTAPFKS